MLVSGQNAHTHDAECPPVSSFRRCVQVWERRAEYQIVESVKFFFNEMERIKQDDFVATQQDVLYSRVRTSGIVTER